LLFNSLEVSFCRIETNPNDVLYRYPCGVEYFERGNRMFPDRNCTNCAVVHNNWIVSRDAKIYRFREHHMWMYDKDLYYSSNERNYILYRNSIVWGTEAISLAEELEALKVRVYIEIQCWWD